MAATQNRSTRKQAIHCSAWRGRSLSGFVLLRYSAGGTRGRNGWRPAGQALQVLTQAGAKQPL